ncbi:MAG: hypothetical protein J3R72DRAFT_453428 [Linnemannia gamsii]|nr:MAG: hypothetical protein J3R72DRAFT_453428 [Linnemannia gamsii]
MVLTKKPNHPLDLPEIRTRIASFLRNKDCISCMCVSKDWLGDFVGPVWNTIDFESDDVFSEISPEAILKYGQHVRSVLNVLKEEHIAALQHPAIASLKRVEFMVTNNKLSLAHFLDIVRRHRESMEILLVSASLVTEESFDEQREIGIYLNLDALNPTTSLTTLTLHSVCITRSAFSSILESSPCLKTLALSDTIILASHPLLSLFRHQSLRLLKASSTQVWTNDDLNPHSPSLFVHFPTLHQWSIPDSYHVASIESMKKLRAELSANCPALKSVSLLDTDSCGVTDYLDNVFYRLKHCSFPYSALNSAVLLALLEHQHTLTTIVMTVHKAVEPSTPDSVQASKKIIGLLLKSFRRLTTLSITGHRMDLNSMEEQEVVCDDLKELRVRFHGLDTSVAIDSCLSRLSNRKKLGVGLVDASDGGGETIGKRVCQQLMRFRKLKTVWLGTRDYHLPTN